MVFFRKSVTRRTVLSLGKFGMFTIPFFGFLKAIGARIDQKLQQIPKIGLQLNSLGSEIKMNPIDTFKTLSFIGYAGLETSYTFNGLTADEYGKIVKRSGLDIIAIHAELPLDKMSKQSVLSRAKIFKCNRIIWHGLPESNSFKTEEGIAQIANKYNEANRFAKSNGLVFGIHNHWWEFEKMENGRLPFDILLEQLDQDIFFELDVYWIAVAGLDPVEIIEKLGPRAPILQVKDGPAVWSPQLDDPYPYPVLAVGTGKMDYPAIFEASKGNLEWIIVDIEACETDIIQAIYESYKFIVGNGYAVGLK
jgi:sugar phosphate isomerase/epimerase